MGLKNEREERENKKQRGPDSSKRRHTRALAKQLKMENERKQMRKKRRGEDKTREVHTLGGAPGKMREKGISQKRCQIWAGGGWGGATDSSIPEEKQKKEKKQTSLWRP